MTGSWAGAMGQTQFMPSSYLNYAVDFDGDGRRDIWKSTRRRARVDRELSQGIRLEWRRDLGTRGQGDAPPCARQIARTIPRAHRRLLRDPQHDRAASAGRMAEARACGSRTAVPLPQRGDTRRSRRRRASASSSSTRTTTRSSRYNCAHYYALTVALLSDRLR